MFKRIDHVEIIPSDFEKSIAFYTSVLGFTLKQRITIAVPPLEEIVYLKLGDSVLELLRVTDPACTTAEPWGVGFRMMALEVEDMDRAIEYLAEQGVPITWGPVNLGDSRRAEIHDIDGLPIELRQWCASRG
jgi:glyoxylase I family protein